MLKPNELLQIVWPLADSGTNFLDLGAGLGRDSIFMAQKGFKVDAVEVDGDKIARIKQISGFTELPITAHQVKAELFPIEKDKYSIINLNNVLQFIEKGTAVELIKSVQNQICPSGFVVISAFTNRDPSYEQYKTLGYFQPNELREYFKNWVIISYHEVIIEEVGHPGKEYPHKHGIAKLIAQKKH